MIARSCSIYSISPFLLAAAATAAAATAATGCTFPDDDVADSDEASSASASAPATSSVSSALGGPPATAVRVIGGEEVLLRSDLYSFPTQPAQPGSNETRLWVPDGPPRAYVDVYGQTRLIVPHYLTYAFSGPNLYSMSLNAGDAISDTLQSSNWTLFNDATWPWSPWRVPDGRLAVINHHEYHCWAHGACTQQKWYPALTFSMANDGVHIGTPSSGVVAKPSYGFNGDATPVNGAYSDPSNVMQSPIDGWYYMIAMFKTGWDGHEVRNCVMRTPNILDPNAWRVHDGASFNALPQNGANCLHVMAYGDGSWAPGSLSYSTYLGKFVYLAFGVYGGREGFWVRTSETNDLTQWSAPLLVLEAPLPWHDGIPTGRPVWVYPSFLDPDAPSLGTHNFDRIGQTPYLYWVRTFAGESRRELVRARVRFEAGAGEIANRMTGLYRVGGGAHYSNGLGTYCGISSMDQLRGCGWPYAFDALPPYNDHGINAPQGAYGGRCTCGVPPVPFGCYRIGGGGFFSNGAGRSCPFLGSQMQQFCGTTNFWSLPERTDHGLNVVDPPCQG